MGLLRHVPAASTTRPPGRLLPSRQEREAERRAGLGVCVGGDRQEEEEKGDIHWECIRMRATRETPCRSHPIPSTMRTQMDYATYAGHRHASTNACAYAHVRRTTQTRRSPLGSRRQDLLPASDNGEGR